MDSTYQKDRVNRLLEFLQEYVKLNTRVIHDIRSYEQEGDVIWFHNLPQNQDCNTPLWNNKLDQNIWLEFKKPILEPQPEAKLGLKHWINQSSKYAEPEIKESIHLPNPTYKGDDAQPEFLEELLKDKPNIQAIWQQYLNEWRKWKVRNEKNVKASDIFSKLYTIYQRHKQNQEILELVLAIGFAQWRPASDAAFRRRHLVSTKVDLHFDSVSGILTLKCPDTIDTNVLHLEDEFLPVKLGPDEHANIKKKLLELGTDIFNQDTVKDILTGIANTLDSNSSLTMDIKPADLESDPVNGNPLQLSFAPALILRKRVYKGILSAYEQIFQEVSKSTTVPFGLARIIDPDLSEPPTDNPDGGIPGSSADDILYFPQAANEEQIKIAERLEKNRGILVQGPPGTGKSHTISNLISHLLAKGKRILVTSETTRALAVLKDKIPQEVSALCVNLLGADSKSFNELESSINGITQRHATFDPSSYHQEILALKEDRVKIKEQQAKITKKLLELRNAEVESVTVNEHYKGTASAIARQVNKRREEHSWLETDQKTNFTKEKAQRLLENLRLELDSDLANQNLPSFDQLISPEEFKEHLQAEKTAAEELETSVNIDNDEIYTLLSQLTFEVLEQIKQSAQDLQRSFQKVLRTKDSWVKKALGDCFQTKPQVWQVLHTSLEKLLQNDKILSYADKFDELKLDYPQNKSEKQILADAKVVEEHLKQHKSWRNFLRIPFSATKGRMYLKNHVLLNGNPAGTIQTLRQVIIYLEFKKNIEEARSYWASYVDLEITAAYKLQIAQFQGFRTILKSIFELKAKAQELEALLEGTNPPLYYAVTPDSIGDLAKYLRVLSVQKALARQQKVFLDLQERLNTLKNSHPIVQKLIDALDKRNSQTWLDAQNDLSELIADKEKLAETNELLQEFRIYAPLATQKLKSTFNNPIWQERFANFNEAKAWQEANRWLLDYADKELQRSLVREYSDLEKKLGQTTAELAAAKAWSHFLSRLTPKQSQSLNAWKAAVKKIGRGTGKTAARYRKLAQDYMEVCIPAIPAWIMPRYRLPEIMQMSENMFDVIIVDEASQTGIDGLFLTHIAKNLVIVGDDQQISPSYIGIKEEDVQQLQKRYLYDIHLAGMIGPATNLYGLAQILFDNRSKIVLREHFRCMPEIIRFSDSLCYAAKGTPLIALRNYPPERLEPLKRVYIERGYQEGSSSNASNVAEAKALVEAISDCVNKPVYEGKTMGIISLLGNRQAEIIGQMLMDSIGEEEIEKRHIAWGNAYSFQGDERDIMFLSLVSSPFNGSRVSALTTDQYVQRFNVASSRAKDQLWLFHSAKLEHLSTNPSCVRRKLLSFFYDNSSTILEPYNINGEDLIKQAKLAQYRGDPPSPFDSWFEVDVFLELYQRGYRIIPQFKVANFRIDLVVEGTKGRLAIECDGDRWHGQEQYQADVSRQRQLERAGWEFFRVRGSTYYSNPTEALLPLWDELKRREIYSYAELAPNEAKTAMDHKHMLLTKHF